MLPPHPQDCAAAVGDIEEAAQSEMDCDVVIARAFGMSNQGKAVLARALEACTSRSKEGNLVVSTRCAFCALRIAS
eukprot:2808019-Alexandrium_andersonii.AAC.1